MAYKGRIRFHEDNYKVAHFAGNTPRSPRKKQKMDLDTRWKAARDMMLQADEEENDGLPSVLSAWVPSDTFKNSSKARQVEEVYVSSHEGSDDEDDWVPPRADPLYDLPGELVLAREKRSSREHWPAKLLEYIPPPDRHRKPKYKAYFFDGIIKDIEKDMFFTFGDEGFKTCMVSKGASRYTPRGFNVLLHSLDVTSLIMLWTKSLIYLRTLRQSRMTELLCAAPRPYR